MKFVGVLEPDVLADEDENEVVLLVSAPPLTSGWRYKAGAAEEEEGKELMWQQETRQLLNLANFRNLIRLIYEYVHQRSRRIWFIISSSATVGWVEASLS